MRTNVNSAHQKFADEYKILKIDDYRKPVMTKEQRNRVVKEWSESMEQQKIKKRENQRKRQLRNAKAAKRKFVGRVSAFVLSGIALFAGANMIHNQYNQYQKENAPITVEQALDNGDSLNSLGIDSEIPLEINEIEKILEEGNLSNEELIKLAPRINSLQFHTAKSKLANVLGVSEKDIRLFTKPIEEGRTQESVKVGDNTYNSKDFLTYKNSISSEISTYIKDDIGSIQDVMRDLQSGDINRKTIIEKYEQMVKHTSQFAAYRMKIDENGNISVDKTKVSELNKPIEVASQDENEIEER